MPRRCRNGAAGAVAILVAFALAGCVESASPSSEQPSGVARPPTQPGQSETAVPTETTGSLVVLVTGDEGLPVPTAQVLLKDLDLAVFTDAEGRAAFNDLSPATYTVLAAKPGHSSGEKDGILVDVVANEVAKVGLRLFPLVVLDATNPYYVAANLPGLLSCGWHVNPLPPSSQCARGLRVSGTHVGGFPNDNSTNLFFIDNQQVQSVVLEATWRPTVETLNPELKLSGFTHAECEDGYCSYGNELLTDTGKSPLRTQIDEGDTLEITRRICQSAERCPAPMHTQMRVFCDEEQGCVIAAAFQQEYDAWGTVFYGAAAPATWSIYAE